MANMISRFLRSLVELPKSLGNTPTPRLIMTLLVKDEEDILEDNLRFHHQMGVDGFIITDNNSTDATPRIIEKYKAMGWILECIEEHGTDYSQKEWVDRMVMLAKKKYKADWIINADADEFWHSPTGHLKDAVRHTSANVLLCKMTDVYPTEGKSFRESEVMIKPGVSREQYDLSPYAIFSTGKHNAKVMHRAAGYLSISMGNHKVKMFPYRKAQSDICIYHYNIRGREHFLRKMINGGKQLEQRKSKHGGRHWRYFYALHKEGKLEAEYERVIGSRHFDELVKA